MKEELRVKRTKDVMKRYITIMKVNSSQGLSKAFHLWKMQCIK